MNISCLGKKYASLINYSAYYKSDEHEVEISDSSKQVEVKSQSQILKFLMNQLEPLVLIQTSFESESLDEVGMASPEA